MGQPAAGAKPDDKKVIEDGRIFFYLADTKLLMNKYLSDVMKKWRETMKEQIDEFQKVAVDIRRNEADLIKNHQLVPF